MKTEKSTYLIATLALAALVIGPMQITAEEDEHEESVTLKQVPAAVRATLERESTGGKIKKIEKENKHGKLIFEADIIIDGKEYETEVTPDGVLISKELERKHGRKHHEEMEEHHHGHKHLKKTESKIAISDVPANIMKAVNTAVPGGKAKEAEKEVHGKKVIYEIEKIVDGKEIEIKVSADGKIIKVEQDKDDEDGDDDDD